MRSGRTYLWAIGCAAALLAGRADAAALQELRCEYLKNPAGIDVERPRLSWVIDPAARIPAQGAYQILAASTEEALREGKGDLWDSGRVVSKESTWVSYGGKKLNSGQRVYWKVRVWGAKGKASEWSEPATWSMGLLQEQDWHAKWIGEKRPEGVAEGKPLPFPWMRKSFTVAAKPARAVAYVNCLGYCELYINGKQVGEQVLSPAVSDYSKRSLYVAYEVADYLVPGKNVMALWLGRGWYVRGHPGVVHDGPLARAQMVMTASGGGVVEVVTDESWKLRESPLSPLGRGTAFGDYGGERYDTALDVADWNGVNYDDSQWQAAGVFEPARATAAAEMVEPNRLVETLKAVKVEAFPQGGWVIDMGRNITGWAEVQLPPIPKGAVVKLEYSDSIELDQPAPGATGPPRRGNQAAFPYTFNQRDEVVGNGSAVTFRSRFNYHGFRYVRVTGVERAPEAVGAKAYLIRTAYERAGEFTSSSELLNRIYQLVTRTYEALTLGGYVVDCPTRERLGYGGDAGTSFETGMYNFATGGLYSRWLANWRDSQASSGSLPHTAPNYQDQGGGGPMWGGFVVTLPWQMYLQYGDKGVLETNYPMMRKWLGYLEAETRDGILVDHTTHAMRMQQWNFLGDWLTPKGSLRGSVPPVQLINTTHYLYQLQLAGRIAKVLGKDADAAAFDQRATSVAQAIHQKFYKAADGIYTNGDTVQQAFPLLTGVPPQGLRAGLLKNLEETILVKNGGHFDTGMHGTYFLMKYLLEADRDYLIYTMTSQRDYPGWGYMLDHGATTSWESWTGQSHIHDTLISIGAWFTQGLAGIRSDGVTPGFRHFVVKPAVVGGLTFVKGKYRSIHGDIASEWRVENGRCKLSVTVPAGTSATVVVPGNGSVKTKAKPAAGGARSYEVAPGTHTFEAAMDPQR
ncbi:MAG: family 78 glycoside hydrolase catalytic domain [Acidobacteria bacterium]|nr:family 78 glycoside hydrolase catalytic domain [Acidobacteriota bacterium]